MTTNTAFPFFLKMFPEAFKNLPNVHINSHHITNAYNFATLVNIGCAVKEMVHRTFKNMVPHTNLKNIEKSLFERYNTYQTLRYLINGGRDDRFPSAEYGISRISEDPTLQSMLDHWYVIEYDGAKDKEGMCMDEITCHDDSFINVVLRKKWSRVEVERKGFRHRLDAANPLTADLTNAYQQYLGMHAMLVHRYVEFFSYIKYNLVEESHSTTIKLHVEDIIDLEETQEGCAYAVVSAIFKHRANNGRWYAFFLLTWFEATSERHSLEVPVYHITDSRNLWKWRRVYPINFVDHIPRVHFVHDCGDSCLTTTHDTSNLRYLKNDYYYTAV